MTGNPTVVWTANSGACSASRQGSSLATSHFMHVRRPAAGAGAIPRPGREQPPSKPGSELDQATTPEWDAVCANRDAKQSVRQPASLLGMSHRAGRRCFGADRPGSVDVDVPTSAQRALLRESRYIRDKCGRAGDRGDCLGHFISDPSDPAEQPEPLRTLPCN